MTQSLLVEPAYLTHPPYVKTLGPEVADLCDLAGFSPDAEQRMALDAIFALKPNNKVASLEAAVIACRQNIKTGLFKMCTLGWLFVTDQRLVTWSAHEFPTAQEAHRDLTELVEGSDALRRRVKAIHRGNGDEAIELLTGQRVKFKARTKTGGRGLSGDKMVMDEAFALQACHMGSLFPTLSARPDPQIVYGSSAGRVESEVLRGIRNRGRAGDDPSLIYIEWVDDLPGECADGDCDHKLSRQGCRLDDEDRWVRANPTLGNRITFEFVRGERRALPVEEFARERLGWWDEGPEEGGGPFGVGVWDKLFDPASKIVGPVTFAVEVADDRKWSCIGVAGDGPSGRHVGSVDYRQGTAWIVDRCKELKAEKPDAQFVIQPSSEAGSLIGDLEAAGVVLVKASELDYTQACGDFYDAVTDEGSVRHLSQPELNVSVAGARKPTSDRFKWDRRKSLDITPLAACTLALWGHVRRPKSTGWFMGLD